MKKKTLFTILRRMLFVVLLLGIFLYVSLVFERKTVYDSWNYTLKVNGFTNEPRNSFQMIGVGSSHMYCTMNPLAIYEHSGVRSYVLATQQQPVEATYYYVKEAFSSQKPDVVVLEAYMYLINDFVPPEGTLHDAVDPFPEGINKINMIRALDPEDGKENYFMNFIKYHTRWKELSRADFDLSYRQKTDPMHGYVFLTDSTPVDMVQQDYSEVEEVPLSAKNLEYLEKTIRLIREEGSEVLLLLTPYIPKGYSGQTKTLHRYAQEMGVALLDMNLCYDELGICNMTDFYDKEHLNVYGAEKASMYLADYVQQNFDISERDVSDDHLWNEDLKEYNAGKTSAEQSAEGEFIP